MSDIFKALFSDVLPTGYRLVRLTLVNAPYLRANVYSLSGSTAAVTVTADIRK